MKWRRLLLLALLILSGCTSVDRLAATLEYRRVNSCIRVHGAYSMFVGFSAVIATGGASVTECNDVH